MAEQVEVNIIAKDRSGGVVRGVIGSFTELRSALGLAQDALRTIGDAYEATVGKAMRYAQQVRDLTSISGQSVEDTARFIQVLDDYQLTVEDAETATRKLTEEGLAPNIETLATLSDQYLRLGTAQEKNEFILKNLGRSGLQWVNILNQGSAAIKANAAAVDQALIPNQKLLDQAETLRKRQDALADSANGLAITVGNKAIPALDLYVSTWLDISNGLTTGKFNIDNTAAAMNGLLETLGLVPPAMEDTSESMKKTWLSAADLEEKLKEIAAANEAMVGSIMTVQAEMDSFAESNANLEERQADLLNQMEELRQQGVEEMSDEMVALQREYANTGEEIEKLADKHDEAMKRIVFDLLMAKLEADGLTSAEFNIALAAGEALGVMDSAAVEMAQRFDALAEALAGGSTFMAGGAAGMFEAAMSGQSLPVFSVLDNSGSKGAGPGISRDSGGLGKAGETYAIGTGVQPEVFVPGSDGWFFPSGGGGGITVHATVVYQATLGTASRADVEQLAPVLGELISRELHNRGISGG